MSDVEALYVQTQGQFGHCPIIFLHSFPLSSDMWKEQMKYFSKTHYTMAPDFPGFGKSSLPEFAITFEYYVDSVLLFLKESGIKKSIWCGVSMGGYLAMRLYEKAPELCSGLILSNIHAAADDNITKNKRWLLIKALKKRRDVFHEYQWQSYIGKSSQNNLRLKKIFLEIVSKNSDRGLSAGLVSIASRNDSTKMLATIDVPTLIIAGDEDKIIKLSDSEKLNRKIKKSKLEILHTGHLSNLENPAGFNKAVAIFLEKIHRAAGNDILIG